MEFEYGVVRTQRMKRRRFIGLTIRQVIERWSEDRKVFGASEEITCDGRVVARLQLYPDGSGVPGNCREEMVVL